ncbi:hypothetical protein [Herbiconiux daphne]|uniref:Uncharacterized protein n=1 Tax=Herbiconiux daphne TaxID=2970914 RepID=A0ABT2H0Q2_9MICO|nr:hypothetical protein [Herbiconiux daphne]MCS5733514.1 hypothetical protein [Herbiconiux daphne]
MSGSGSSSSSSPSPHASPPPAFAAEDRRSAATRRARVRRMRLVYGAATSAIAVWIVVGWVLIGDMARVLVLASAAAFVTVAFSLPYLWPPTPTRKRVGLAAAAGAWVSLLVFVGVWLYPR